MEPVPESPEENSWKELPAHEFLKTHSIKGRSSSTNVARLIESMKQEGWKGHPIVVIEYGGEKYILDGHHRTYAARIADIKVRYRLIKIDSLQKFGYDSVEEVIQAHAEAGYNRIRHV